MDDDTFSLPNMSQRLILAKLANGVTQFSIARLSRQPKPTLHSPVYDRFEYLPLPMASLELLRRMSGSQLPCRAELQLEAARRLTRAL